MDKISSGNMEMLLVTCGILCTLNLFPSNYGKSSPEGSFLANVRLGKQALDWVMPIPTPPSIAQRDCDEIPRHLSLFCDSSIKRIPACPPLDANA